MRTDAASEPTDPGRAPRQSRWPGVLLVIVSVWALLGYLILPWCLHALAPRYVHDLLDVDVSIGDVYFDPFDLDLRIHDLRVTGPMSSPDFEALPILDVTLVDLDLSGSSLLTLQPSARLHLVSPTLHLRIAPDGTTNLQALLASTDRAPAADAAPAAPADPGGPRLFLGVRLEHGLITVQDRSRPGGFATRITDIGVTAPALALPSGPAGPVGLQAAIEGAHLDVTGSLALPDRLDARLKLDDLPLALVDRWLADSTPVRDLEGRLGVDAGVHLAAGAVEVTDGQLTLDGLGAAVEQPLSARLDVARLALTNVRGAPLGSGLRIGAVQIDDPVLQATWTAAGRAALMPSTDGDERAPGPAAEARPPGGASSAAGGLPPLVIEALHVTGARARVTDRTLAEPASLALGDGRLDLGALTLPADPAAPRTPIRLALSLPDAGRLAFDGDLQLAAALPAPRVQGHLDLTDLALPALAPWAAAFASVGLDDGALSLGLDLELDAAGGATVDGDVRLADLAIRDPDGVHLLGWKSLAVDGIHVDSAARRARIANVALTEPSARFARLADGSTNLDGIGPAPTAGSGADAGATSTSTPQDGGSPAPPWAWQIDTTKVEGGRLDFVDETLAIPFGTTIEALGASLDDLTSAPDARTRITLDGRVPPNGSARVEASLSLDAPKRDSRLGVHFRQVPMPQLTPYVGTFAGYRVAGGRLDLDLDYRVSDGTLQASNHMVARALRLGPKVDSPQAMDLPLQLALALLRDGDDEIRLDVPVSGNLDDPDFDIRPVVLRAIGNVVTGIVTAPFKLLASLVPGGQEIDQVAFPLGSAQIPDAEQDRFVALETALGERPSLTLVVAPTSAGDADRDALRIAALDARLAATGETGDAALRTLFAADYGDDQLRALDQQYARSEQSTGNQLQEMRGRLLADTRLAPDAVEALARARAEAVRDQLAAAGLDPARVEISAEAVQAKADREQVVMHFDLTADAPADDARDPPAP